MGRRDQWRGAVDADGGDRGDYAVDMKLAFFPGCGGDWKRECPGGHSSQVEGDG